MRPEPAILAFDTSAAHCAAALLLGDRVLAAASEPMAKGQADRLMPLLAEILAAGGLGWRDLAAIGVGTGPGNFTGIRISVAAARGLALSLGIPAIGVTGFEALAEGRDAEFWALVPGPRDTHYAQRRGPVPGEPLILPDAEIAALDAPTLSVADLPGERLALNIGLVAAARRTAPAPRPAPLYIRPADAAPMRAAPPVLLP